MKTCKDCRWMVAGIVGEGDNKSLRCGCDNVHERHITESGAVWYSITPLDPKNLEVPDWCPLEDEDNQCD